MTDLRAVPRLCRCTGCGAWLHPKQWGQPADLALIEPVAQVILGEPCGCAGRETERIREVMERMRG